MDRWMMLAALLVGPAAPDFGLRRRGTARTFLEPRSVGRFFQMGFLRLGNTGGNGGDMLGGFLAGEDRLDALDEVHGACILLLPPPEAMQKNPRRAGGANLLTLCT